MKDKSKKGGSSARYLDVSLFADNVSLVLWCFLKSRDTYEFSIPTLREDFPEALKFFEEAKNGKQSSANLHTFDSDVPALFPSDLASDVLDLLKEDGYPVQVEEIDAFCDRSITTLKALIQEPKRVTNEEVKILKIFFDSLRDLAAQRTPEFIDMGGYGIVIH